MDEYIDGLTNFISRNGYLSVRSLSRVIPDAECAVRKQDYDRQQLAYGKAQETIKRKLKENIQTSGFPLNLILLPEWITSKDLIEAGFPGGKNAVHSLFSCKDLTKTIKFGKVCVTRKRLLEFFKN